MLRFATHKIETNHLHKDGKVFSKIAILNFIAASCFWTIFPLILVEKLQNENHIGYYYSILSLMGAIISVFSTYIFCKYSKVHITKIALSLAILTLLLMNLAENVFQLGLLDIPRAICILIANMSLAIFVKDFSTNNDLPLNEAKYFRSTNIGCLIGPILGGISAKMFGNESIYILSSIFLILSLAYFAHQHFVIKNPYLHHNLHDEGIKQLFVNIKDYFKNIELIKVFLMALGLNVWWSIRTIYIPLSIREMSFNQEYVGFIVSAGIIPMIIFESIAGKLAQKNGVRRYFIFGFLFITILTFSTIFIKSNLALILIIILSNIGAAFIEPLKDTYFFEVNKKDNPERFYGIYNIAEPVGFFIAPIITTIMLGFLPNITNIWSGVALIMGVFFLLSLFIKKKY